MCLVNNHNVEFMKSERKQLWKLQIANIHTTRPAKLEGRDGSEANATCKRAPKYFTCIIT